MIGLWTFKAYIVDSTGSNSATMTGNVLINPQLTAGLLTGIQHGHRQRPGLASDCRRTHRRLNSPYTYNWFNAANCGGTNIGSGATLLVSPLATNTYSFNSVDSATTKNVVCSASNTVTRETTAPTLRSDLQRASIRHRNQLDRFSGEHCYGQRTRHRRQRHLQLPVDAQRRGRDRRGRRRCRILLYTYYSGSRRLPIQRGREQTPTRCLSCRRQPTP